VLAAKRICACWSRRAHDPTAPGLHGERCLAGGYWCRAEITAGSAPGNEVKTVTKSAPSVAELRA